jgi:hypothetical protein
VTSGVPRLVNIVCDGALLTGYGRGLATVGRDVIREVARDLKLYDVLEDSGAARGTGSGEPSGRRRGWLGFRRAKS